MLQFTRVPLCRISFRKWKMRTKMHLLGLFWNGNVGKISLYFCVTGWNFMSVVDGVVFAIMKIKWETFLWLVCGMRLIFYNFIISDHNFIKIQTSKTLLMLEIGQIWHEITNLGDESLLKSFNVFIFSYYFLLTSYSLNHIIISKLMLIKSLFLLTANPHEPSRFSPCMFFFRFKLRLYVHFFGINFFFLSQFFFFC